MSRSRRTGEVYNIGGGCARKHLEVVRTICRTVDTGIERMVRWYLDNAPWIERVQSGSCRQEWLGLGA